MKTDKEISEGYETVWVKDIDDAISLVRAGKPTKYGHDFERLRELAFLERAKQLTLH